MECGAQGSGSKIKKRYKYYLFRRSYGWLRIQVYSNRDGEVRYTITHRDREKDKICNEKRNKKISRQLKDKEVVTAIKYMIEHGGTSVISDEYKQLAGYLRSQMKMRMRNKND